MLCLLAAVRARHARVLGGLAVELGFAACELVAQLAERADGVREGGADGPDVGWVDDAAVERPRVA